MPENRTLFNLYQQKCIAFPGVNRIVGLSKRMRNLKMKTKFFMATKRIEYSQTTWTVVTEVGGWYCRGGEVGFPQNTYQTVYLSLEYSPALF